MKSHSSDQRPITKPSGSSPQPTSSPPAEPPAVPDFAYLLQAAREALQRGDLENARIMVAEAEKQAEDDPKRLQAVAHIEHRIAQRRDGREDGIQQRVDTIRQSFADGELMTADRLLFQAIERFGDDPRFDTLRQALQQRHRDDLESEIRAMMQQADELSKRHQDIAATELIHKARAVVPPNCHDLSRQVEQLAEALRQRAIDHREQRLEAAKAQIDEHLSAFDLASARGVAASNEQELANPEAVSALRRYLQWRISEGVHQAVNAGNQAVAGQRFGLAVGHLRQALALKPDDAWLRQRLQQVEERQLQQEKELQQDPAWSQALASIGESLLSQQFAAAERQLQDAVDTWGHGSSLDALQKRLSSERREHVRALLQASRAAHRDGDAQAARRHLERALQIDPEDPSARNLAEALERPQPVIEMSQASPEAVAAIEELSQLCDQSNFLEARRKVKDAIATYGELEPLQALQRRIAQELLDGF